jgi:kinesin family protein 3/17
MAAIRALEARSLEFMREKEEKRLLEERIAALTSQVIQDLSAQPPTTTTTNANAGGAGGGAIAGADGSGSGGGTASGDGSGGGGGGGSSSSSSGSGVSGGNGGSGGGILGEQQERLRHEYEGRLMELEKERECIEEEKAQVDRYKQLLLKQRDIMIALTQRLNERDEQIMALQVVCHHCCRRRSLPHHLRH